MMGSLNPSDWKLDKEMGSGAMTLRLLLGPTAVSCKGRVFRPPALRVGLGVCFGHECGLVQQKEAAKTAASVNVLVPRAGLEPARPNGHMALNHACLPISAPGLVTPLGLEPRTLSLKVRCSNQLS